MNAATKLESKIERCVFSSRRAFLVLIENRNRTDDSTYWICGVKRMTRNSKFPAGPKTAHQLEAVRTSCPTTNHGSMPYTLSHSGSFEGRASAPPWTRKGGRADTAGPRRDIWAASPPETRLSV